MNDKDKKNKQDGNNWDWINQILWSPYGYFKRLFGLEDNENAEPTTRNSSSEVKKDNSIIVSKEVPIKKKPIQEEELKTTWPMTKTAKKKIAEKKQKLAAKRKKPVKKTVVAPVNNKK
jgi:hypothetical protein